LCIVSHLTANPSSATTILSYLADPVPESKPHTFLLPSYTPRPYKKWHSEINSICRDTFWIFLHPQNIIPISPPHIQPFPHTAKIVAQVPSGFKGGVEWCATEYLTAHLAVMNAVLAGVAGAGEREQVRRELRDCGFEGVMGGKLRKSSREYYPGLHGELQTWCWEGHVDGWRVGDVARGFGEAGEKQREEEREEVDVREFEVPTAVV
jgi:hypothetical protein